jgi:hypothetical protein
MKVKRIHYSGGLTQDRFLENGGGHRKPTLLRVKALMSDQTVPEVQHRIFGLVLESDNQEDHPVTSATPEEKTASRANLSVINGGYTNADK